MRESQVEDQIFYDEKESRSIFTIRNLIIGAGLFVIVVASCAVALHFQYRTKESSSSEVPRNGTSKSSRVLQVLPDTISSNSIKGHATDIEKSPLCSADTAPISAKGSSSSGVNSEDDDLSKVKLSENLKLDPTKYFEDCENDPVNLRENKPQRDDLVDEPIHENDHESTDGEDFNDDLAKVNSNSEDVSGENLKLDPKDAGEIVDPLTGRLEDGNVHESSASSPKGSDGDRGENDSVVVSENDYQLSDEENESANIKTGFYSFTFVLKNIPPLNDVANVIQTGKVVVKKDGNVKEYIQYKYVSEDINLCGKKYLVFLRHNLDEEKNKLVLKNYFNLSPRPEKLFLQDEDTGEYILPLKNYVSVSGTTTNEIRSESLPVMIKQTGIWKRTDQDDDYIDYAKLFKNLECKRVSKNKESTD